MPDRHAALSIGELAERDGSAAPPSPLPPPPSPARQDTIPGMEAAVLWPWSAPAPNDFSPTATAWRAAKALSRTERHRSELAELRESLNQLREIIDAGTTFLADFRRLVKWAAGLLGGAGLLAGGGATLRYLLAHFH